MSGYSCETCYWRLTGCSDENHICSQYYPNGFDDDFSPPPEPEYAPTTGGVWGRRGFSVVELEEQ